ncbi:hypothetical protein DM02DRAFT_485639, partial [Periconia macrospinosa]
ASSEAHFQIVQLLFKNGTDVNTQGRHYSNALQAASATGHDQMVKLLLDKCVD